MKFSTISRLEEEANFNCIICDKGKFTITLRKVAQIIKSQTIQKPENEICPLHNKNFRFFCITCKIKICHTCSADHLEDHDLTSNLNILNKINNICHDHQKELKFQCATSNIPFCNLCNQISHKYHNLLSIMEFYENLKKDIMKKVNFP